MTAIHEFTSPYWVRTPLGDGRALLLIDYGLDANPVLFVHLDSGLFKCIDSNDARGCENQMLGVNRPDAPMMETVVNRECELHNARMERLQKEHGEFLKRSADTMDKFTGHTTEPTT